MEKTIFVLSLLAIFQFLANLKLTSVVYSLKKKINSLEKEVEEYDEIIPGDKVIFELSLTHKKSGSSFDVKYEADVVEVSSKKIKVNAYSFVCGNLPNDLQNKQGEKVIIDYMQGEWIDREKVSPLLDKETIRNKKLNKILN